MSIIATSTITSDSSKISQQPPRIHVLEAWLSEGSVEILSPLRGEVYQEKAGGASLQSN